MAKPKNIYAVILDRSGSMQSRAIETVGGFNSYVEELKEAEGKNRVSLYQFDDQYDVVFEDLKPKDVKPLDFKPRGLTALLDAVGRTITSLDKIVTDDDNVTVVIMTDGGENASQEYSKTRVQGLIKEREAKGNWTFVYLGASEAAWGGAQTLGIHRGNTLNYAGSAAAHTVAFDTLSYASKTRSSLAAKGEKSTVTYFEDKDEDGDELVSAPSLSGNS